MDALYVGSARQKLRRQSMNSIVIKGRLTADPELKHTSNDKTVCNFSVAVNRRFQKDQADFFRVTAWGTTAEFVSKYFSKGQEVIIRGAMQSSKYEKNGESRTAWDLQADEVGFCGSKSENQTATRAPDIVVDELSDDDLPF